MATLAERERWWMTAADADMLYLLADAGKPVSLRKRTLVNVACCRRIWPLLRDERCRLAVDLAEARAVGLAVDPGHEKMVREGLSEACQEVGQETDTLDYCLVYAVNNTLNAEWVEWDSAATFAAVAYEMAYPAIAAVIKRQLRGVIGPEEAESVEAQMESARQADLIRDVFGNPFQSAFIDPTWRTPTVEAVAWSIFQERRFSEVGVLADALIDSGCTSDAILRHLQQPGEHVLGCWVVDLILGQE